MQGTFFSGWYFHSCVMIGRNFACVDVIRIAQFGVPTAKPNQDTEFRLL